MDFEIYKIGCVIKDYCCDKYSLTIGKGNSEINFKVSNSFDVVTLCTNLYYDNPYNDVELKLKKYIDENYSGSSFIPYSELGNFAIRCLKEEIKGLYDYNFWVYGEKGCVEITVHVPFNYIKFKQGKLGEILGKKYESIELNNEYLEKIRKDYDDMIRKRKEKRKSDNKRYKEIEKIKELNYKKVSNVLKFSSSKNLLKKSYSIFLLDSIINDKNIVLTFNYNSSSYIFRVKFEYNQIYFSSSFRMGDSINNPNDIELNLSKGFINEYLYLKEIKHILDEFLDYSYGHTFELNISSDNIELKISSSLDDIATSNDTLEKTLREMLLDTSIYEEDYKKYDELWDKMQKPFTKAKEEVIKEEKENREKNKKLMEDLKLDDNPRSIKGDSLRW